MDRLTARQVVLDEIERRGDELIDVSHRIHANPELGYEERFAHDVLADSIEGAGLEVARHAYGLETAFAATAGGGHGPKVALLCEYDALPGIGHACGHNIIAAAGLGAGLAAATVAAAVGGQVLILGTPAEEGGGGKQKLIDAGAFDGVDIAMMVHPSGRDLSTMHAIAIQKLYARYHGKAAHAAAAPWRGVNALDAAVLGYVSVAALRQHILPDERIHGIFLRGGDKPNIVPEYAEALWYVRSTNLDSLQPLKQRVLDALQGAALATGAEFDYDWDQIPYADMIDNGPLLALYAANAEAIGRPLEATTPETAIVGSTDMGNVSYAVPSIHPMIKAAPADYAIHTTEFAAAAASPEGDRAVIDGAKAMALTTVDFWFDPQAQAAVQAAFRRRVDGLATR